jgi:hypothetical protein
MITLTAIQPTFTPCAAAWDAAATSRTVTERGLRTGYTLNAQAKAERALERAAVSTLATRGQRCTLHQRLRRCLDPAIRDRTEHEGSARTSGVRRSSPAGFFFVSFHGRPAPRPAHWWLTPRRRVLRRTAKIRATPGSGSSVPKRVNRTDFHTAFHVQHVPRAATSVPRAEPARVTSRLVMDDLRDERSLDAHSDGLATLLVGNHQR